MKKNYTLPLALLLSVFSISSAFAFEDAKLVYKNVKLQAEAEYKIAKEKCSTLTDNPKDICLTEAKAKRVHLEENAEANYTNTLSARTHAAKKIAEADYEVAKAHCDSQVGNDKDVCVKKAKSTKIAAIATAKADMKVSEARTDEADAKKDAEYKVAMEKCDGMVGAEKDACIKAAKLKFGK